ncbi:DUF4350 domain-containing protein [Agromyces sp. Marseille-Q5079]|uniref:DUF4350 domain-containing protein n=1 Tax=Agromyces sp. Marseille-Q5079 TaxID=3439059 RepID=UPI003D9C8646
MTTTTRPPVPRTPAAPAAASGTEALTPTARAFLRRGRTWIGLAAVLLIGAVAVLAIQGGIRAQGEVLGPDDAGAMGSGALVEVLRDHGVTVTPTRSLDATLDAVDAAGGDATVLLYDEFGTLDDTRLGELAGLVDAGTRLVVAEPGFRALEALAPGVRLAGEASGGIEDVACDVRAAMQAGALSDGQRLLTIDDAATTAGWRGCFRDGDLGFALAVGPGPEAADLTGDGAAASARVSLVGAATVFTNDRIDELGNAALAIGLLGATEDVVWYLPGPTDADAATAPTLGELTPGWVSPVMVLALVVALAAGVWRGRRLGPLVVERLPVTVPAGETRQGRARLYARSSQRGHALDQLRMAAVWRLAATLRLPRATDVSVVAEAAALATGRDAASVMRLLVEEVPTGDAAFAALGAELADLERDVVRAVRPDEARPATPDPERTPDDQPGRQP